MLDDYDWKLPVVTVDDLMKKFKISRKLANKYMKTPMLHAYLKGNEYVCEYKFFVEFMELTIKCGYVPVTKPKIVNAGQGMGMSAAGYETVMALDINNNEGTKRLKEIGLTYDEIEEMIEIFKEELAELV